MAQQTIQSDNVAKLPMNREPLFLTTLAYDDWHGNARDVDNLPPDLFGRTPTVREELTMILRVLQSAFRDRKPLLLDSSNGRFYPDVIACVLLGFLPKRQRPLIALYGDMWQPNSGFRGWLERIVIRLADRAIDRYFVLSTEEVSLIPELWGVNPDKMRVQPYHISFTADDLEKHPSTTGTHIFAGGNSNRDYRPLIEAARQLPQHQFIIATRRMEQIIDPPPNVTAGPVTHDEFVRLMRSVAAVVVANRRDLKRSSGQQTYLNSIYIKKVTILNVVPGVGDHVRNGVDAIVVDGSPESYVNAIQYVFDPANHDALQTMVETGHEHIANNFTVDHFVNRGVALMREMIEDAPRLRG